MNVKRGLVNSDQLFWGLFLIAAGTFTLLGRLGVLDFSWSFHKLWPLFIVVIGISKLVHRRSVWSGLWMIAVGAWLQAVTLHLYHLTYQSSWPFLLVILGAGMIIRTVVGVASRNDDEESEKHHV